MIVTRRQLLINKIVESSSKLRAICFPAYEHLSETPLYIQDMESIIPTSEYRLYLETINRQIALFKREY